MKIKLIDFGVPEHQRPYRPHGNDAGADVYLPYDCTLQPGEIAKIPLGFGLEIPDGYYQDMQPSYYDNQDGSLCFVCDQPDMYYFLYGEGWAHTQTEMLERGLTLRQYEEFARLQNGVLAQFTTQREILFAGQPFQAPESYLRNAELYEEGQTGNYNMLDGRLNNEPPVRPDLTDGQTDEEIRELVPEAKPSLMDRLKADKPEHEARQMIPPVPERER